jgi:8-oxo-dGTP pyrophosphatase MutT (NUDIX family)
MIEAAGIAIVADGDQMLFLKRSDTGEWALPGGHLEPGELHEAAARRECEEETGLCPPGAVSFLWRHPGVDVDFTTFLMLAQQYEPVLNDEHTAALWAPVSRPPQPLHPGVREVIDMAMRRFTEDKDPKFFTVEQLGLKQSFTPEGYLLCEDVPIGRTGTLLYRGDDVEVPVKSSTGRGGPVEILREANEVFRPETIASFAGKSVTMDHPPQQVTPDNHRVFNVGTVMHPRRGEGSQDDLMLADLLITDKDVIKAIRNKEIREVSSGYDSEYQDLGGGRGRQYQIIGNHVALVDHGRCGTRCSIGDTAAMMRKTLKLGTSRRALDSAAVVEELRGAFLTKDQAVFDAAMEKLLTGTGDAEPEGALHLHIGGDKDGDGASLADVHQALGAIAAKLDSLTNDSDLDCVMKDGPMKDSYRASRDKRMADKAAADKAIADKAIADAAAETKRTEDAAREAADKAMRDAAAGKDPEETEEQRKTREAKDKQMSKDAQMTMDSVTLETPYQETLSLAEILAPGIRFPTFDRRANYALTQDALCTLRRRALDRAMSDADVKPIIHSITGDADLTKLPCAEVTAMFTSSALAVKQHRTRDAAGAGGGADTSVVMTAGTLNFGGSGGSAPPTAAELNEKARKFWDARKA